jgi:hypothetical protein
MMMIVLVALLAALAFGIFVVVNRGRQIGELARRGVPVTATVTRRFATGKGGPGSSNKRIGFTYRGPDGREYERFASVTGARFHALADGDPLPIYVLPDDPGTSAPALIVDPAREALARRNG